MESRLKNIGLLCFWTALLIELIIVIVDKSAYTNPYESTLFRLTFLLFCVKAATTKYSIKEWGCILFFGAIAVTSYFINERDEAVRAAVFVVACKDCSLTKNLQTIFLVTLTGCAIIVLLSVTGIYGNVAMTVDYGREGIETRYTMGMGHPNAFHGMMLMLIVLALYLYADRMKWYHYVVIFLANIAIYLLSNSNTSVIVGILAIVSMAIMRYVPEVRTKNWPYFVGGAIVLACIVFSITGAYMGNGGDNNVTFMFKLDKLLNGRYEYCYKIEMARLENWRLFGAPENVAYFDAGFVRLFYWYGIVPALGYIGMNFYLIIQSKKYSDCGMLVMITVFAIYSLMEAHLISVYLLRNYLLVLMGYYWYQPFREKQEFEGYFWQVKGLLGRV